MKLPAQKDSAPSLAPLSGIFENSDPENSNFPVSALRNRVKGWFARGIADLPGSGVEPLGRSRGIVPQKARDRRGSEQKRP